MFIDLLIRQVYLWSFGNNQRKFDPFGLGRCACKTTRPHREEPVHESKNQFPPPVPLISGKGRRNVHRRPNRFLLHKHDYFICAINMEDTVFLA